MYGKHPYTGEPNENYVTVVLRRHGVGRIDGDISKRQLIESMQSGKEAECLPGWEVTAFAIGDEISENDAREDEE